MMKHNAYAIGIDIGSTAAKVVVLGEDSESVLQFAQPTGWNGKETAETLRQQLKDYLLPESRVAATGYGRVCVEYADKTVTEITCHGRGAAALFGENGTVIDVGGQDTKIITLENGRVRDFLMNDKCAAGTGKFIEVMAMRLGTSLEEFYSLAAEGTPVTISSMCTVFAESEVISYIGMGQKREDLAAGIIHSVAGRVAQLAQRHGLTGEVFLTGGLCESAYFLAALSEKLGRDVTSCPEARYAGALGAALTARRLME